MECRVEGSHGNKGYARGGSCQSSVSFVSCSRLLQLLCHHADGQCTPSAQTVCVVVQKLQQPIYIDDASLINHMPCRGREKINDTKCRGVSQRYTTPGTNSELEKKNQDKKEGKNQQYDGG